jgi:hypothetical protein
MHSALGRDVVRRCSVDMLLRFVAPLMLDRVACSVEAAFSPAETIYCSVRCYISVTLKANMREL